MIPTHPWSDLERNPIPMWKIHNVAIPRSNLNHQHQHPRYHLNICTSTNKALHSLPRSCLGNISQTS